MNLGGSSRVGVYDREDWYSGLHRVVAVVRTKISRCESTSFLPRTSLDISFTQTGTTGTGTDSCRIKRKPLWGRGVFPGRDSFNECSSISLSLFFLVRFHRVQILRSLSVVQSLVPLLHTPDFRLLHSCVVRPGTLFPDFLTH